LLTFSERLRFWGNIPSFCNLKSIGDLLLLRSSWSFYEISLVSILHAGTISISQGLFSCLELSLAFLDFWELILLMLSNLLSSSSYWFSSVIPSNLLVPETVPALLYLKSLLFWIGEGWPFNWLLEMLLLEDILFITSEELLLLLRWF